MDSFLFTQSSTAKFCVKCRRFNALNSCTCESTSFFLFFSFVNDYVFCYFLALGLVSGLGFNVICL